MTTSLANNQVPRDLSRSLTLRFSALLLLFLVLSGGTYLAVSSAVSAKKYDSIVVNLAGRQRMLTQQYAREINQVLYGLAVSDRELAAAAKQGASQTAERYEEMLAALYEGGEVDTGRARRIWIPRVQGGDIVEQLDHVKRQWDELQRASLPALRSDIGSAARNEYFRDIQRPADRAVAAMDRVVTLLQAQSEARLSRVDSYMIYACILSVVLFVGSVVFVRRWIVAPLDDSMTALRGATVRAETADRAKSEFLANMSHEIRTPMTAILGFMECMCDVDQTESEKLNCIHTVRRNGEYLLGIINDILDLSKIEAGKMAVEHVRCKPCQIVAEACSMVRVRADAKGLAFNIEYIGAIPETMVSDPTRLRQILINLIGNAIKFTEVGAVRLVVRFVDRAEDDRAGSRKAPYMQFDVLDTGLGMSDEQAANLFQPFAQAEASTTRKFGGTGLGLTISKRFAELLGGDVRLVESEAGVGTCFRATVVTGPLDGARMLDDPMSGTVVVDALCGGKRALSSDLHGVRILLAEDGADNQRLISLVLKKAGAEVTVVENGDLALEAALAARDRGDPFDCILMDMQMPVMDGYQATGKLREKSYTGPIIALTAHAMAGDRQSCIDAGCDDYASKPINREKLIAIVQQHACDGGPVSTILQDTSKMLPKAT